MVAIAFSGIDQIDSQFRAFVKNRVGFGLRIVVTPFTSQLPRTNADNRNSQFSASKNSVFHFSNPGFVSLSRVRHYFRKRFIIPKTRERKHYRQFGTWLGFSEGTNTAEHISRSRFWLNSSFSSPERRNRD